MMHPMGTGILSRLKSNNKFKRAVRYHQLYLLILPTIMYYFIFHYIPIYGIQIAFRDYMPALGFTKSPWVGLKHFIYFFNSADFDLVIRNTIIINLYQLIAGFPMPIIISLFLNHLRSRIYKKIIQTTIYAPHFISTVVMVGIVLLFLSPSSGCINLIIKALGHEPIFFMGKQELFKSIYVWSGVWQNMGWGTVIYFAALSGVNPELYEASAVDGASKLQKIRYIDIPCIMPTATILLILNTGRLLSMGYEKILLLQNSLNRPVSEVISTYVYKQGIISARFSYSAAIGVFNSVVNLIILNIVNRIARRYSETSLF